LTLLGYLHDTGVLYYREGYFQKQIILNQTWAIEAVYKILDRENPYHEVLEHQKGILVYKNLCKIWKDNTDEERKLFIDFMLSAELAFETTEEGKYEFKDLTFVIPQLLPLEKPNDIKSWEQKNAQHLQKTEISYRFLPKVFIQRFIVKANRFSEVRLMWQKGLLLKTAQGSAVVEACYEKEKQLIIILSENEFITKKINEELAEIANEGRFKSKEGESENLSEKFGLAGLNAIFKGNDKIMHTTIQKALEHLQEANHSGYFEEMDKVVPLSMQTTYQELKGKFITGQAPWNFHQQLEIFARYVDKVLR
jgi:internalin A